MLQYVKKKKTRLVVLHNNQMDSSCPSIQFLARLYADGLKYGSMSVVCSQLRVFSVPLSKLCVHFPCAISL